MHVIVQIILMSSNRFHQDIKCSSERFKPLYIVSGNHDVEGDLDTGLLYQAFETRFRMPHVKPPVIGRVTKEQDIDLNRMYQLPYDFGNSFYSYENGLVHNIVLNSFADFEPGSNQYKWIVHDLENVNRDVHPWILVLVRDEHATYVAAQYMSHSLIGVSHFFNRSTAQYITLSRSIELIRSL